MSVEINVPKNFEIPSTMKFVNLKIIQQFNDIFNLWKVISDDIFYFTHRAEFWAHLHLYQIELYQNTTLRVQLYHNTSLPRYNCLEIQLSENISLPYYNSTRIQPSGDINAPGVKQGDP